MHCELWKSRSCARWLNRIELVNFLLSWRKKHFCSGRVVLQLTQNVIGMDSILFWAYNLNGPERFGENPRLSKIATLTMSEMATEMELFLLPPSFPSFFSSISSSHHLWIKRKKKELDPPLSPFVIYINILCSHSLCASFKCNCLWGSTRRLSAWKIDHISFIMHSPAHPPRSYFFIINSDSLVANHAVGMANNKAVCSLTLTIFL